MPARYCRAVSNKRRKRSLKRGFVGKFYFPTPKGSDGNVREKKSRGLCSWMPTLDETVELVKAS